jgi:hypothetical protein
MTEQSTTRGLVELTSRQLQTANRGDLDSFMSVFAPDPFYDASRDGLGVYQGPAAIRGLIGGWWAAFEDFQLTPEQFVRTTVYSDPDEAAAAAERLAGERG